MAQRKFLSGRCTGLRRGGGRFQQRRGRVNLEGIQRRGAKRGAVHVKHRENNRVKEGNQRAAPGFSVQIYSGELIELSKTVRGLICSTASSRPSWLSDISRIK